MEQNAGVEKNSRIKEFDLSQQNIINDIVNDVVENKLSKIEAQISIIEQSHRIEIKNLNEQITNQNEKITHQNKKITHQNKKIRNLNEQITNQNEQNTEQTKMIKGLNDCIKDENKKFQQKENRYQAQIERLKEKNDELRIELKKSIGTTPSSERNKGNLKGTDSNGGGGDNGNGNGNSKSNYPESNKQIYDIVCLEYKKMKRDQKKMDLENGKTNTMTPLEWHLATGSDPSLIPASEHQMDCPIAESQTIVHPIEILTSKEKQQAFGTDVGISTTLTKTTRLGFKIIKTVEEITYQVGTLRNLDNSENTKLDSRSIMAGNGKFGPSNWKVTWEGLANALILSTVFAVPMERIGRILGDEYFNASNISRWVRQVAWQFLPIYNYFFDNLAQAQIVQMDDAGLYVEEMNCAVESNKLIADSQLREDSTKWDKHIKSFQDTAKEKRLNSLIAEVIDSMGRVSSYRNDSESKKSYNLSCVSWASDLNDTRSTIIFFRTHFGSCANLLSNALQNRSSQNKETLWITSDSSSVNQLDPDILKWVKKFDQGCYHHARRYVKKFENKDEELASYLLLQFLYLDEYEWIAFAAPVTLEKIKLARNKAKGIWKKILEVATAVVDGKIHSEAHNQVWPEGTSPYASCKYIINHYDELTRYLTNHSLKGNNSFIERALRPIKRIMEAVHVRKSEECQVGLDIIRTMASSCECAGINFQVFLEKILKEKRENLKLNPKAFTPFAISKQQ